MTSKNTQTKINTWENSPQEEDLDLSIVIPTLREFDNLQIIIPKLLKTLNNLKLKFEIIIVDDESETRTLNLITSYNRDSNIILLANAKRRGLAQSALEGFKTAKGKIILLMDGDESHNPNDIGRVIFPITNGDSKISVGSRYLTQSKIVGWTLPRIVISKASAILAKPVCGLSDPGSGFFCL